jgi:hypothetical protein
MMREKVMVEKMVSKDELKKMGHLCAWDGCGQKFKGDMPEGWTWLCMYWSKQPVERISKIPVWVRDSALCPEHSLTFDGQLKALN